MARAFPPLTDGPDLPASAPFLRRDAQASICSGRDQLIAQLRAGAGERVLEIGCGTGRNLIEAARRYPGARYFGIDISTEMLSDGKANIARAELGDRISVARGDAAVFDPAGCLAKRSSSESSCPTACR